MANIREVSREIQKSSKEVAKDGYLYAICRKIWRISQTGYIFATMAYKKLKSVRLDAEVVNLVKDHKKATYIPIGAFFELAAKEKLERERQQKEQQKETK